MQKIILSAFADEYSSNFDSQIKVLKDNNFENIELRFIDGVNVSELTDEQVKRVKSKLNDANLGVSSLGSPLGKINLNDDFNAHLEKTKRTCETACELNAKRVRMFSFYLPEGKTREDCKNQVLDYLSKMLDIANEFGVTFCHENEAKIYGESPEKCLELIKYFNGKLKCVFDMGNFVLDGYNPLDAYEMLKDYIEYFHIKDSLYAGAIVPAGKGEAQIEKILSLYKKEFNRDFIITLEPHLQTFSGLNALVGKTFENPYKYESQEIAFLDAISKLKEII